LPLSSFSPTTVSGTRVQHHRSLPLKPNTFQEDITETAAKRRGAKPKIDQPGEAHQEGTKKRSRERPNTKKREAALGKQEPTIFTREEGQGPVLERERGPGGNAGRRKAGGGPSERGGGGVGRQQRHLHLRGPGWERRVLRPEYLCLAGACAGRGCGVRRERLGLRNEPRTG